MSEGFDPLIHAPNRLKVCALLEATSAMEFKAVKDHLEVSDSVLSKQIKQLEEVGYVIVEKRQQNGRVYTWLQLSTLGRSAFRGHVLALKQIVGEM
ncbi:transcriptional regulator [Psychrobium sp. 1_MG-2023]|uniref:transcriptional regulator n=1 Tax=Psychrobium sp. 1_MG-2023 TaxID=3062624 RepID=UPI000C34A922|nr:transcriptional regulator [Psychrobium sp. 1_MG-2023]MDP2561902.1 transcriptional regulator [Psychrobium sp. 1_MG-2023]PKF59682.1 MarR family transcriptional regulator [Alteromonadales bacterium alter-6D02]